ncbi:MAG TPA: hypothetical protein VF494_11180 [Candidatus Limnocylindrales bacterium]
MIRRWLANVGLAGLLGVVWVLGLVAIWLVGSERPTSTPSVVFGLLYGLFEWAIFGVVPVLVYLVIGELIWPRVARRRLASIMLGAVVVVSYSLVLQAGQVNLSPEAVVWLATFAAVGATFGAIARLPGPPAAPDVP